MGIIFYTLLNDIAHSNKKVNCDITNVVIHTTYLDYFLVFLIIAINIFFIGLIIVTELKGRN